MKQNITADIYAGSKWLHNLNVENFDTDEHDVITIITKMNIEFVTHMSNVILIKRPINQKTDN